jgi:hypothetical protein
MLCRFTVMFCSMLVMIGGLLVMLMNIVAGHSALPAEKSFHRNQFYVCGR